MDDIVILYTTWPDAETARGAGRAAVEARLAACANVMAPVQSIYRWNDSVEEAGETPMLLKTTQAAADRLRDLVLSLHPYETPCVVAAPMQAHGSHIGFTQWIKQQVS
jgi:periplasmic divalent cation tolerance protein